MIQISKIARELNVKATNILKFLKSIDINDVGIMSKVSDKTYKVIIKHYKSQLDTINYKNEVKDIKKIISENRIVELYHFTDESNIESIKQHGGLFSWDACDRNEIEIINQASNDLSRTLDKNKGLENYIRLSFNRNQPMLYVAKKNGNIKNEVILKIDTNVILWEDTLFSDVNATSTGAIVGKTLEDLQRIDLNIALSKGWDDEEEKAKYQAEILVKEHIPLKFIKNI